MIIKQIQIFILSKYTILIRKKTTKLKIEKIIKNIQTKITKCLVFIVHLKPYLNVIDVNFPTIN